jgi:hypothetical protein
MVYARVCYGVSDPFVAADRGCRALMVCWSGRRPACAPCAPQKAASARTYRTLKERRENTVAEARWFGAPLLLVTASWFVDYTVLAVAVLLCATLWLLLHMAGVRVCGSFRFERGRRPFLGRLRATVTLLRREPHLHG